MRVSPVGLKTQQQPGFGSPVSIQPAQIHTPLAGVACMAGLSRVGCRQWPRFRVNLQHTVGAANRAAAAALAVRHHLIS
jgi:hypothetical protein